MNELGKRIIDISELIGMFEAGEGEVQHIIGKTGMGKTYEATRRALKYLRAGNVLYTTWKLNLPDHYDQRERFFTVLKNIILFRKNFFRFDYKKNWHYVNLDDFLDDEGIMDTEKLAIFLATRTDCIFMLDEGQDVFDSHKRAGQIARQSITRTRHMHKTLIIISQRAQAVDVTARGNVTFFYKCVKRSWWFLGDYFKVYITDEIDETNNQPLWVRHDSQGRETWKAPIYFSGWGKKRVYDAYDSWYMRKNMVRSQQIHLDAYELGMIDKIRMLFRIIFRSKKLIGNVSTEPQEVIPLSPELSTVEKVLSIPEKAVSLEVKHYNNETVYISKNKSRDKEKKPRGRKKK